MVVEDGVDTAITTRRPASAWLVLILGFALGLGFGVLITTGPATEQIPSGQPPIVVPDVMTTAGGDETLPGLGSVVPGWTDSLVAIAGSETGVLRRVVWPRHSEPRERPMTVGKTPTVDASGLMVAAVVLSADSSGDILLKGRFNSMQPVASGITSFAWHDRDPAWLAYTTVVDAEWRLWVAKPTGESVLVATEAASGGRLATWGEWGFAIETEDGEIRLLTPEGLLRDTHVGTVFDSHGSGWIAVANERIELVSSGGGVRALDASLDVLGTIYDMTFSADGELLAVSASDGMGVVPVGRDSRLIRFEPGADGFITWSSDQRYVIFPASRGVFIQDLAAGTRHRVLEDYVVLEAAAVPGGGS